MEGLPLGRGCVTARFQNPGIARGGRGLTHAEVFRGFEKLTKKWSWPHKSDESQCDEPSRINTGTPICSDFLRKSPIFLWFRPYKGSHPLRKVQFFWTLFKRPLTPPLYLNICPILQGVFFKTRFWALKIVVIMYLFHPQISPSMPQKSLFMQTSCC